MENASKALVMAGAILISILLISVGLIMFNSTKGVTDQSKKATEALEKESFNSQFTKYCGDRVSGSKVNNLKNFVASYTSANPGTNISIVDNGITIMLNKYYKVEPAYSDGYVTQITISNI